MLIQIQECSSSCNYFRKYGYDMLKRGNCAYSWTVMLKNILLLFSWACSAYYKYKFAFNE